jgi:hypothetical protein
MRRSPATLALAIAAAALVAGCGGSGITPPQVVVETAQQPAKALPGWKGRLDHTHGFSIALPPGWTAIENGDAVLFRSPDHLVAVSLSVDRTEPAFSSPPAEFARQTLAALPGYRSPLQPGPPRRIAGTPLQGVGVRSSGVAGAVRQNVEVAVLRRDRLVNYTAVIAANAKATPTAELALADRMLKTIRDFPIS